MKNIFRFSTALSFLFTLIFHPDITFAQGSLTPSAAPAPMMKTLAQVEPRTLLSSANTPGDANALYVINQPGAYYLTANVVGAAGKNGIRIEASGVTLDLMGFELTGNAAALNGILAGAGTTNITILNGSATGWSQHGIDLHQTSGSLLENVRATANGGRGFSVGVGAVITRCVARHNISDGLSTGDGAVLKDCNASTNGGSGLIAGSSSLVKDCVANGNGTGSTGIGILVTSRATVSECTANQNRNDGIRAASDCRIVNNHASANGTGATAAGIHTTGANNHIDQNHTSDNSGYGILSSAGVNADVVIRNVSRDNGLGNFLPNTGSTFGPLGTPATATSPWANFLDTFQLTVSKNGTGTGSVSSSPGVIDCGATCSGSFVSGATVTLTATPDAGSTFAGWSGAASGLGTASITMDSSKTVTATFNTEQSYNLSVTRTGSGTVSSSPSGIYCGAVCGENYTNGTVVTLTAVPDAGWVFAGWSGAATGTGTAVILMDGNKSVTATFVSTQTYALSVSRVGSGTVSSSPTGIFCGADCGESYASNTVVTLTAVPAAGWAFTGWSGAASGSNTNCTITMDSAKSVTATFTQLQYTLTTTRAGTGAGTVSSSPVAIYCGAVCAANFDSGTIVTMTAVPDSGSTFAGWSGAASGTGTANITMDSAKTVTATFTLNTYDLTVIKAGTGTGTVTSAPAGINCGSTCTAGYSVGTTVTLTATPGPGSTFLGWSGAATGTGSAVISMTSAKTVTATFSSQ